MEASVRDREALRAPVRATANEAVVACEAPEVLGGQVRWAGSLDHGAGDPVEVRFDFTCPDLGALTPSIRPFLLAFLPAAMRIGTPIRLTRPIDAVTVSNLMEWQEAMVAWHPKRLQVIPIRADLETSTAAPPPSTGGICAFSGGVDSCFTAVRSATAGPDPGYRSPAVSGALMVHGFDIDLEGKRVFDSAFARSQRILTALGVAAYRMRTDVKRLRKIFGNRWGPETHGIWIAAALACVEDQFTHTVIPSTYPYPHEQMPWASNPRTDPLLSSATRPLWHDGAAHDKLSKVRRVAGVSAVTDNMRVCWEGTQQDRNCGGCFKCVATQACLWLSGVPNPGCFERPCDVADVAALSLSDPYKRALARRMRREAASQGDHDLERALAQALRRRGWARRVPRLIRRAGSRLRQE